MTTHLDTTIAFPQMADSHPDFDQSTLPSIPPEWTDVSWHNDGCPSFNTNNGWFVFIDYAASYQREDPNSHRFWVIGCDADGCITEENGSLATDDWEGLLKWL